MMSEDKKRMWALFWSFIAAWVIVGIVFGLNVLTTTPPSPPLKAIYSEFLDRDTGTGSKEIMTGPVSAHEFDTEDWDYEGGGM